MTVFACKSISASPCNGACDETNVCLCQDSYSATVAGHGQYIAPTGRYLDKTGKPTQETPNSEDDTGNEKAARAGDIFRVPAAWQGVLAACRTNSHGTDDFGCESHDPNPFLHNRSCFVSIENDSRNLLIICPLNEPVADTPITVRPHQSGRQAYVHMEPSSGCRASSNTNCSGIPINSNELTDYDGRVYQEWQAWNYIALDYKDLEIIYDPVKYPQQNKMEVMLMNLVLQSLPLGDYGLDQVRLVEPWSVGSNDLWSSNFDALAPGGVGAAEAPVIAEIKFHDYINGCKGIAELMVVKLDVWMNLTKYYNDGFKGVYPTVCIAIHGDMRWRRRWEEDCHEQFTGNDNNGLSRPKMNSGFSTPGNKMIIDEVIPRYSGHAATELQSLTEDELKFGRVPGRVRFRCYRGATSISNPRWRSIDDARWIGNHTAYCCCLVHGLDGYDVGAYVTDPEGSHSRYSGKITLGTSHLNSVTANCGTPEQMAENGFECTNNPTVEVPLG